MNKNEATVITVTASEFVNNFGKRNQEVQRGPIEVTSHGRRVGYYVSAHEFDSLDKARKTKLIASIESGLADIKGGNHREYDGGKLLDESLRYLATRRQS